jgi:hypothetical protein
MNAVVQELPTIIPALDIGCGPNKAKDHIGMDAIAFPGVDVVHDLRVTPWPFADNSVETIHCSHVLEHLTNLNDKWERVKFFNELWRVMVPVEYNSAGLPVKGVAKVILPHWSSTRYYGDPTHKEPFSEFGVCYLDPQWRKANAPHTDIEHNPNGYDCHWAVSYDYSLHQNMAGRNQEYLTHAITFWKEAAQDLILTMSCIKK